MNGETLIGEYFRYLSKIENRSYPIPKFMSDRTRAKVAEFLVWCAERNIREPILFMQYRLDNGRARRFRIPLGMLKSEALAKAWGESAGPRYRKRNWEAEQHRALRTAEVERVKALRPIFPATETYQYHHVNEGRTDVCMNTQDLSGGYHPSSRVCPNCPSAIRCADKLNQTHGFDVVALRRGQLNVLPAHIASAAIG